MALYPSSSSARAAAQPPVGITEFEILKASHKFLRDEDDKPTTWDEKLAEKYYSSLYREFAVCDLKHYKSGNFALRWRTEEEVLAGAGETTCGNTRCDHHFASGGESSGGVSLTTLELPFAYIELGEVKSALVKVVLCRRCVKKLMYKREKDKAKEGEHSGSQVNPPGDRREENAQSVVVKTENTTEEDDHAILNPKKRSREGEEEQGQQNWSRERAPRRRRRSRSQSPPQHHSRHSKGKDSLNKPA